MQFWMESLVDSGKTGLSDGSEDTGMFVEITFEINGPYEDQILEYSRIRDFLIRQSQHGNIANLEISEPEAL